MKRKIFPYHVTVNQQDNIEQQLKRAAFGGRRGGLWPIALGCGDGRSRWSVRESHIALLQSVSRKVVSVTPNCLSLTEREGERANRVSTCACLPCCKDTFIYDTVPRDARPQPKPCRHIYLVSTYLFIH